MLLDTGMSDIVQMTSDVGSYTNGQIYRMRSKNADQYETANQLVILDNQVEPTTTIEGA